MKNALKHAFLASLVWNILNASRSHPPVIRFLPYYANFRFPNFGAHMFAVLGYCAAPPIVLRSEIQICQKSSEKARLNLGCIWLSFRPNFFPYGYFLVPLHKNVAFLPKCAISFNKFVPFWKPFVLEARIFTKWEGQGCWKSNGSLQTQSPCACMASTWIILSWSCSCLCWEIEFAVIWLLTT